MSIVVPLVALTWICPHDGLDLTGQPVLSLTCSSAEFSIILKPEGRSVLGAQAHTVRRLNEEPCPSLLLHGDVAPSY